MRKSPSATQLGWAALLASDVWMGGRDFPALKGLPLLSSAQDHDHFFTQSTFAFSLLG